MATRRKDPYEQDFYAWTQDRAGALHRLAEQRWTGPLDLAHLALEVEDLGRSTRTAVRSRLQRIIENCMKLEHSSASEPRAGWMNAIDEARDQIENLLTPSLERDLEDQLSRLFARTRRRDGEAADGCRKRVRMGWSNSWMRNGCRSVGTGPRMAVGAPARPWRKARPSGSGLAGRWLEESNALAQ